MTKEQKEAFERWKEHCREVQTLTAVSMSIAKETPVERDRRIKRLLSNYDEFCEYYFSHFLTLRDKTTGEVIKTIHNAPFHSKAALKIRNTPKPQGCFQMASRPCQINSYRCIHSIVADIPTEEADQLYDYSRQV